MNKKFIHLLILFKLVFTSCICFSQEYNSNNYFKDIYFGVSFSGFYNCDTLSLLIDDQYILQNQIYTSLQSEFDYSFSVIYITFKKENEYIVVNLVPSSSSDRKIDSLQYNDSIKITNNRIKKEFYKKIKITIILNGLNIETYADISKDKFIFFNKVSPNKIKIFQNSFIGAD